MTEIDIDSLNEAMLMDLTGASLNDYSFCNNKELPQPFRTLRSAVA